MKKSVLFALWGGMYALCAGLGFLPGPEGFGKVLLVLLAAGSFVPPMVLVFRARREKDTALLKLIRNLAALWLLLTVGLLLGNFISISASVWLGDLLYYLLVIVSSPMICGQYWVMSLFLWAFLLFSAIGGLKDSK